MTAVRLMSARPDRLHDCADLGMSPDRARRAMDALSGWGLRILKPDPGLWRLSSGPLQLLSVDRIQDALSPALRYQVAIRVFPVLDSTNRWLMAQPVGQESCLVCLAEYQSAGRGRRGRHWATPFGGGIALSLRWDVSGWRDVPPRVTLALGLAVAEMLRTLGVAGLVLKWPNDLMVAGRKLGGILVEQRRHAGRTWLVAGIGFNLRMPAEVCIDQPWTDLASVLHDEAVPERNQLAALMVQALVEAFAAFPSEDPERLVQRWARMDALAGRPVCVEHGDSLIHGVAAGVDTSGRLRVMADGRQWLLDSGEVSVRSAFP